jgi:hypothetical protein
MGGALRENGARGGERSKLRWSKITKDKRPNDKRNPKKQKTKKNLKHKTSNTDEMWCKSRRDDLLPLTLNLFRGRHSTPSGFRKTVLEKGKNNNGYYDPSLYLHQNQLISHQKKN